MKLRNGIIYITLAVILLVFSTMAAIYVHNMSKDLYRSQGQALKAKMQQYSKIAILSVKNWVDFVNETGFENISEDFVGNFINDISGNTTAIEFNIFWLNLDTWGIEKTHGFSPSATSVKIENITHLTLLENKETIGSESGSLYALIDASQTNLLAPSNSAISVYGEEGNSFSAQDDDPFERQVSPYYRESVIYRFERK